MVVRRIREHVSSHNWFAVGVDLVIVVIGVFLGMQVNNWNESRIEAAEGRSYRARLIDELNFNIQHHRQQSAYYRQVLSHGLGALRALEANRLGDPAKFVIDAVQLTQVDSSPGKSYIYNEMVSAGLVSRLGDARVQQAASDYYVQVSANDRILQQSHPYRDIVRGLVSYPIQATIQLECGDRPVHHGDRVIGVRLVQPCAARLDPALAAESAARVRDEPGIERAMLRYLGSLHERLASLNDTLSRATQLKQSLSATAPGRG